MQRQPKSVQETSQLLQLTALMSTVAQTIIDEWSKESTKSIKNGKDDDGVSVPGLLPSRRLYESQRTMLAAAGMLPEVVADPSNRLLEISSQYFEARALHIVAERRIPDLLYHAQAEDGGRVGGLAAKRIGESVGIEPLKLCM